MCRITSFDIQKVLLNTQEGVGSSVQHDALAIYTDIGTTLLCLKYT